MPHAPAPETRRSPETTPPAAQCGDDAGRDVADVVDRLRAGHRAIEGAALAYTAAHGHPLTHLEAVGERRWRWAFAPRAALTAAFALAVVVGAVVLQVATSAPGAPPPPAEGDHIALGEVADGGNADGGAPGAGPRGTGEPPAPLIGTEPTATVLVHVVGQVHEPGVVELPAGARVADALAAAGGPTADADLTAVNLARPLVDGEQVHVPEPGEAPPTAAAHRTGDAASGPVHLNTAGVEQLQTLPGIGPVLAQRIVDWRATHGPFLSVDELLGVAGIGPTLLDGLRDQVTV